MSIIYLKIVDVLFKIYKVCISPFLGNRCRFYPSCSEYAAESLKVHGPLKGSYFVIRRIIKCAPYCEGGVDPVPLKK